MDWLIDTTDAVAASSRALTLLDEYLQRHAVDPAEVRSALTQISSELTDAVRSATGQPVHLRLDWVAPTPELTMAALPDTNALRREGLPVWEPVPARQRGTVRSLATVVLTRLALSVERISQHTFDAGPPPVVDTGLDIEGRGAGVVAVALAAALDAHPTASAPQAATIAGSLIANAGIGDGEITDGRTAAEAFVRLYRALGSEAYVVAADDDVVELAVTRCPFGATGSPGTTLCHVSSGLAGQLAARVNGAATVVVDESIAAGDPECHLQVLLHGDSGGSDREPYFWPPRGAQPAASVPHLDLSVSLPRESVSVPVVRRLATQALRAFGVDDEDVDDVQVAITEACANVIDHAAATDTYDVKIELAADRCAITVVDQGVGFDATSVPRQAADDAEVGRGLTLMRALVDNLAFRNEPQAGAVVHMVKTLHYDASHPMRHR
jgi:serine/threonine-protein kinase RsbW